MALFVIGLVLPVGHGAFAGEQQQAVAEAVAAGDVEEGILLNFPENVELKVLVEYVSRRLGMNILYDEQIGNKRVTIQSPTTVPGDSLLGLLESVLRMKGLALADGDQPGWKEVVQANNLLSFARSAEGPKEAARPGLALTRVFKLGHADPKRVEQIIKPFLTQPGGNTVQVQEHDLLIVTDYATNMPRVSHMVGLVDQPSEPVATRFVPVVHQEASALAQQALRLVRAKIKADRASRGVAGGAKQEVLEIVPDERTNQLVLVGTRTQLDQAMQIIRALDVSLDMKTRVYQFEVASPERVDRLTKELIGPLQADRVYRSSVDPEAGLLVVSTTEAVHAKIEQLKADLDLPVPESQSPIRVYRLANAKAADVLETIRAIEGAEGLDGQPVEGLTAPSGGREGRGYPGANNPPAEVGEQAPTPPAYQPSNPPAGGAPGGGLAPLRQQGGATIATVAADINTNSLIVVAPPSLQTVYKRLIDTLDRRRPQVLVEVTIVTLDTSGGFSLGVEITARDASVEGTQVLSFSSFGLSSVDAVTGALSLNPGLGFNGAVIDSGVADVVIRALSTNSRSRVVSAPRLLVNDNATGTLSSVTEEPFTSVNASDTVATTSFAGFVSAGTDIVVTPHISEGDHLSLEYSISLNSFSDGGGGGVPPPRKTDSVNSEVTVPDGQTIIVGGLNRKSYNESVQAVPILGEIPLLGNLFRNQTKNNSDITLFVFIRPVILRDDRFADLKYISGRDVIDAGLEKEYPVSGPSLIQ